ncbi:hypothetical protein Taro_026695 [Colocasia esculenta]|uniref:DYW domain-containing protein n=1 Tax=Colocasia esculenta TaxID=4460 RepID=A0A843VC21_COLES|nr:hypothetical protein [Colocasia esculenta]
MCSSSLRTILSKSNPVSLLDSAASLAELKQVHAQLLVGGLLDEPRLLGKLVASLALSQSDPGALAYAEQVLSHSRHDPTIFAFNSLIRAYSKSAMPHQGFQFYRRILRSGHLPPDNYTFTFLVRSSAQIPSVEAGAATHGAALRWGFGGDAHVQSGLIHMYAELGMPECFRRVYEEVKDPDLVSQTAMVTACARCGEIDLARQLFDAMPMRDSVAWNAMIAGYEHLGRAREALRLFHLMQLEGMKVNEATMVSVLSACAHMGALDQGRWAHVYIERNRLYMTVTLGTSLIDMYAKCGDMKRAMEVFWTMRERNIYTWSTAMNGLTMNGAGESCLELFRLMQEEGVLPNEITFVSVLRGCSVAGLVEKGCEYFDMMISIYRLEPWLEHYGCMVDLYGRAGRLDDALGFIHAMPIEPHVGAWGALLSACRIYKNTELGEYALKKIVELESRNDGAYVLLSNIYADSKNWDGANNVRELMKAKGVRKEPGCSAIEVGGEVHEFFVGDKSHPRYGEIEVMLGEMARRLRVAGYVAKTNQVLFDIEEEEKEDALCWHSEKLAIAFGLISLQEGVTIRIVKNLRVCHDCHDATKFISKIFNREIVCSPLPLESPPQEEEDSRDANSGRWVQCQKRPKSPSFLVAPLENPMASSSPPPLPPE